MSFHSARRTIFALAGVLAFGAAEARAGEGRTLMFSTEGRAAASLPSFAGDGRWIAFVRGGDVFVHDRHTGRTVRASVADEGSEADDESGPNEVEISSDGSCVLFDSFASNLASGGAGAGPAFYVRELRNPAWRLSGASAP